MIEKVCYVMLDTSQYIKLIDTNRIGVLNSPEFISSVGFPFITLEHIYELGKTNSFETFQRRLNLLETVRSFATFKNSRENQPNGITEVLIAEIDYIFRTKDKTLSGFQGHFFENVKLIKLVVPSNQRKGLYDYSQQIATKTGLLSTLNLHELNPFLLKKMKDFENHIIVLDKAKEKIAEFRGEFDRFLAARVSNEPEHKPIADLLSSNLEDLWIQQENYATVRASLEKMMGEPIDPEMTLLETTLMNEFVSLKRLYAKKSGTDSSELSPMKMADTNLCSLNAFLRKMLELQLLKENTRKIETSNQTDLYFCVYSLLMTVYSDKRTIDFIRKIGKYIKQEMRLESFSSLKLEKFA